MSHAPSTLGTMITSSLSPIWVTSWVRSSSTHGDSRLFTRVQRAVSPRSEPRATSISPWRASSLRSTGTASSRLPSRMSVWRAMSGALAAIFSFEKSRKWIIRDGLKGISRSGSGAPTASGLKKSRGFRIGRSIYRSRDGRRARSLLPRRQRALPGAAVGDSGGVRAPAPAARTSGLSGRDFPRRSFGALRANGRDHLRRRLSVLPRARQASARRRRLPGDGLRANRLSRHPRAPAELARHRAMARGRARAGAAADVLGPARRPCRGRLGDRLPYTHPPAPDPGRRRDAGDRAGRVAGDGRAAPRPAVPDARLSLRRLRRAGGGGRGAGGLLRRRH